MDSREKPVCKFGEKCYRKNPQHFEEYEHKKPEGKNSPEKKDEFPKKKRKAEHDAGQTKKKGKIEDFFSKKNFDKEVAAKPSETSDKDVQSSDDKLGNTSGYVREVDSDDEDVATGDDALGNTSGYTSEEEPEKVSSSAAAPLRQPDDTSDDSPTDVRQSIKSKFLVEMPEDFYDFWKFCETLYPKKATDALSKCGLRLVGPYDVLARRTKKLNSKGEEPCYLRHWRYYFDPPEFLTVLRGDDKRMFHIGYFRDDPAELPVFLASNSARDSSAITPRGENIFAAVHWYLEKELKDESEFSRSELKKMQAALCDWVKQKGWSLEQKTAAMKQRDRKVVCKAFHNAGIVVPMKNDIGYRPLPETNGSLKKIFQKITDSKTDEERTKNFDPLMEIITLVQFANDECDYGEGLELGIDLFCFGSKILHQSALNLLSMAYRLLGRNEFGQIVKAHLSHRKRSADLDELT